MFIDSHCHLDFPELAGQLDAVLQRMQQNSVDAAMCISVSMPTFPNVLALAERDPRLWATVGVHPGEADTEEPGVDRLVRLAAHPRILAIGETGLDYYRLKGDLEWQRERFRTHVRAARACGKPLVVHTRAASKDTIRILREEGADAVGGVMHCFTEDWQSADAAMELGFCISFSGIVTFGNARELREVARRIPDERLLIETDAPYLAPVPHRGRTNEPAFVRHVAQTLAEIRNSTVDHVGEVTTENFLRVFRKIKQNLHNTREV